MSALRRARHITCAYCKPVQRPRRRITPPCGRLAYLPTEVPAEDAGMSVLSSLTGEISDSKVAALFDGDDRAQAIAHEMRSRLGLRDSQVQVINPHDRHPGRKLLPEGPGIFRTILIAHYKLDRAEDALSARGGDTIRTL